MISIIEIGFTQNGIIFPKEFPVNFIGKKLCGTVSTSGKMMNGYTAFLEMPIELVISADEGVYARYNPGEKFGRDEWGSTARIMSFELLKIEEDRNQFGNITGRSYHYVCPKYDINSNYNIKSFYVFEWYDNSNSIKGSKINLEVYVKSYNSVMISSINPKISICEILKTQIEIQKEKEELLKIENQKKELDKLTSLKIDSLLSLKLIEDAALSYDQLNFSNLVLKNKIQSLLVKKHETDTVILDNKTIVNYINYQVKTKNTQLHNLGEGVHEIRFNTIGNPINKIIPSIGVAESNVNIPSIKVGSFNIKQNSKAVLTITEQDSILVSNNFSSGCTQTIYVDKNENFYLKTKTGLPAAYFTYNYKLDERLVRIYKEFKQEKYINGVVTETKSYNTEKFIKILKKEK
jgi:hypothetical protein